VAIRMYLGGARSGKSRLAQEAAAATGLPVCVLATAQALDDEMQQRIHQHQRERPEHWQLCEAPFELAQALQQLARPEHVIVVDCLTLWLSNLLCFRSEPEQQRARAEFFAVLKDLPGECIFVSNEVGQGLVAETALGRQFVDEAGRLHQQLAAQADEVFFVVAGLVQVLKCPAQRPAS
jgi:adenosylcobinamide kinase / adenosylcobinamide-phosphate guanylyltransferase